MPAPTLAHEPFNSYLITISKKTPPPNNIGEPITLDGTITVTEHPGSGPPITLPPKPINGFWRASILPAGMSSPIVVAHADGTPTFTFTPHIPGACTVYVFTSYETPYEKTDMPGAVINFPVVC